MSSDTIRFFGTFALPSIPRKTSTSDTEQRPDFCRNIFSMGVMLLACISLKSITIENTENGQQGSVHAWVSESSIQAYISSQDNIIPTECPEILESLVYWCCDPDPKKRPFAWQVLHELEQIDLQFNASSDKSRTDHNHKPMPDEIYAIDESIRRADSLEDNVDMEELKAKPEENIYSASPMSEDM